MWWWWWKICLSFVARAVALHVSRSGPHGMQPVFDAFNHGFNSTSHDLRFRDVRRTADNAHMFVTRRDIAAGEEIFNTFRPGAGLGRALVHRMVGHGFYVDGAPEFFRDYGFIEKPPVLWWFNTSMLAEASSGRPPAGKQLRWVIEDDAGSVYWPDAHSMDWGEFVMEAQRVLRALDDRSRAYGDAGVRCASYIHSLAGPPVRGAQPVGVAPRCGTGSPSDRRVLLALLYRAAFESAVRAALAAAEVAAAG
ncbi:unnamed protein product [Prorocentrum cordatum]|uniref:SET domain-containing protein n=1 Tax=Prorocentrum cordatum TaxID=2364126 RepID=A0ABN9S0C1_9DINO|nr:unnamed protein product [Polarella glacialis]